MDAKPPFSRPVKEYFIENYICDENGNEIMDYKANYKYDRDNKLSEVYNYNSKNELLDMCIYTYDNNQNLTEVTVYTADKVQKQSLVYEYENNKLSQVTDTSIDLKTVTKFDDYGSPLEKQNIGENGEPSSATKYINLYDQNNRLIEKHTLFPSESPDRIDKYRYSEEGLLIEEQRIRNKIISTIKNTKYHLKF